MGSASPSEWDVSGKSPRGLIPGTPAGGGAGSWTLLGGETPVYSGFGASAFNPDTDSLTKDDAAALLVNFSNLSGVQGFEELTQAADEGAAAASSSSSSTPPPVATVEEPPLAVEEAPLIIGVREEDLLRGWWDLCKELVLRKEEGGQDYFHGAHSILFRLTRTVSGRRSRERTDPMSEGRMERQLLAMMAGDAGPEVEMEAEEAGRQRGEEAYRRNVTLIPLTEALLEVTFEFFVVLRTFAPLLIANEAVNPLFVHHILNPAMQRTRIGVRPETRARYAVPELYAQLTSTAVSGQDLYDYQSLRLWLTRLVRLVDPGATERDVQRLLFLIGFGENGAVNPRVAELLFAYGKPHADYTDYGKRRATGARLLHSFLDSPDALAELVAEIAGENEPVESLFDLRMLHPDIVRQARSAESHTFDSITWGMAGAKNPERMLTFETANTRVLVSRGGVDAYDIGMYGETIGATRSSTPIGDAVRGWANARAPLVHVLGHQVSHPAPRFFIGANERSWIMARNAWGLYSMLTDNASGNARLPATYTFFNIAQPLGFARAPSIIMSQSIVLTSMDAELTRAGSDDYSVSSNVCNKLAVTVGQRCYLSTSMISRQRPVVRFLARSAYGITPNAHVVSSEGFEAQPGLGALLFNKRLFAPIYTDNLNAVGSDSFAQFNYAMGRLSALRDLIDGLIPDFSMFPGRIADNIRLGLLPVARHTTRETTEYTDKKGNVRRRTKSRVLETMLNRRWLDGVVDFYMKLGDALFLDPGAETYWGRYLVLHTYPLGWPASLQAAYYYALEALLSPAVFAPFFYEPECLSSRDLADSSRVLERMFAAKEATMRRATDVPGTWHHAAFAFAEYMDAGGEVAFMDRFRVISHRTFRHHLFFQRAECIWKKGTPYAYELSRFATAVEHQVNGAVFTRVRTGASGQRYNIPALGSEEYLQQPYAAWARQEAERRFGPIMEGDEPSPLTQAEIKARYPQKKQRNVEVNGTTVKRYVESREERMERLWEEREATIDPLDFPLLTNDLYNLLAERALTTLAPDWRSNTGRNDARVHTENIPSFFSAIFQYACLTPEERGRGYLAPDRGVRPGDA